MTKNLTIFCLLLALAGAISPLPAATDRWQTLRAINWVENPTNHSRYGSKGELGPYQFRSQTWRLHTSRPFGHAVRRDAADEVAVKHYEWIRRGLQAAGIDPNPYNIALAWNSGLTAVVSGRVPTSTYRYAEQVSNLVEKQRLQAGPAVVAAPASAPETKMAFSLGEQVPAVRFGELSSNEPKFVVAAPVDEPMPVVVTEKSAPVAAEKPLVFMATVTAPRFSIFN